MSLIECSVSLVLPEFINEAWALEHGIDPHSSSPSMIGGLIGCEKVFLPGIPQIGTIFMIDLIGGMLEPLVDEIVFFLSDDLKSVDTIAIKLRLDYEVKPNNWAMLMKDFYSRGWR